MFGRKIRTRLDDIIPPPENIPDTTVIADKHSNSGQRKSTITQEEGAKTTPDKKRLIQYAAGERVMVRDYKSPQNPEWRPAHVKQRIGKHVYLVNVQSSKRPVMVWKRHVEQMQRNKTPDKRETVDQVPTTPTTETMKPEQARRFSNTSMDGGLQSTNASMNNSGNIHHKSPDMMGSQNLRRSARTTKPPVWMSDYDCADVSEG